MDNSQCCVCYVPTGEFTPCAHPLCGQCCLRLVEPVCPLCRQNLNGDEAQAPSEQPVDLLEAAVQRHLHRVSSEIDRVTRSNNQRRARSRTRADTDHTSSSPEIQRILAEPIPIGPFSSRRYLQRSWLGAGLPGSEAIPIQINASPRLPRSSLGHQARGRRLQSSSLSRPQSRPHSNSSSEQEVESQNSAPSHEVGSSPASEHENRSRLLRHQWSAWMLAEFPDASAVAAMSTENVLKQVRRLGKHHGGLQHRKALAQALVDRAHHLGRLSTGPDALDHLQQLLSAIRELRDGGLLEQEEAVKHVCFLNKRVKTLKDDEAFLARMRDQRTGISGQPLAQLIQHLDGVSEKATSAASELQSVVCWLRKSGLLGDQDSLEHLRFLNNRMLELKKQDGGRLVMRRPSHNGLSGHELRHREQHLHQVLQSLVSIAIQLQSTVRVVHSAGFVADDEAAEHFKIIDDRISECAQIEATLSRGCSRPKRSSSLPR